MQIIPTILCDDTTEFKKQWRNILHLKTPIQIDITDNTLTPSQTLLPSQLGKLSGTDIIFHLMSDAPDQYLNTLAEYRPKKIILHVNTNTNWSLWQDHFTKAQLGIALNPENHVDELEQYIANFSEVLIMTVHPGSIGQPLLTENLEKISAVKKLYPDITVSVDGGIKPGNIKSVAISGADIAYIGSAITRAVNPSQAYRELLKEGNEVVYP